jgi:hypothetical protein
MFAAIRRWFRQREIQDTLSYAETQLTLAITVGDKPRINRLTQIIESLREESNEDYRAYG